MTQALSEEKALAKEIEDAATEEPVVVEPPTEESNQSMEEGEMDLSNMIVIDECCDPSKQKSEESPTTESVTNVAVTSSEKVEKEKSVAKSDAPTPKVVKKLDEKDIRQLQRRYTLPETPEIIVHPSRTAKGGKFDCTVTSLSVLLDYRQDDSKEHSFEVYLFAELFNEMLMRDAGFNIYKTLHALPERKEEDEKDKEKERAGKRDEKEEGKSSKEDVEGEKKREKERKKQVTYNPDLLLSFAYFDQTHCGYILCKDLEDLLSTIGLSLSKAQIRKVVKKGAVTDSLYYR